MIKNSKMVIWLKSHRYIFPVVFVFITFVAAASIVYFALSAFFLKSAEDKIKNVIFSQRALHIYIQKIMHPTFFSALAQGQVKPEFYAPQIFSSSYIVRNMHAFYNEEMKKDNLPLIYYKMAADNPRNPLNLSDKHETELIKMFNADRSVHEYREVVSKDGKKFLYYAIPFLENNANCLRCHGKREDAPPGLQALYHGEGGFNEKTGVFRAVESIRVPIGDEISTVFVLTCSFSAGVAAMFLLLLLNRHLKNLVDSKTANLEAEIGKQKLAEAEIQRLNSDLEKRVVERTAQLESANKELEAFCYSVSHDLRAPLRHIDGYVDLLVNRCRDSLSEKGLHYLDTISGAANQMGTLIDDLLDFSRTGRAEMCRKEMDMNQAIREALVMFEKNCAQRKIEWSIAELPRVSGDYALLRQVWVNLLGNAIKYTRSRETAVIDISWQSTNGEVVFVIRDNGVGFDMQYAGKLFGVFQRLHRQEEFEGTGIGLATVQRIIARHGGRIWAEASLGKGAAFFFTLPS